MANIIYCNCCESAKVETIETPTADIFYMCTICRDYCAHLDVNVRENNFNQQQVTDYSN
jgi:hypothetical protein